ncbi:MAG: TAT-variant-translocated molybdopterin oxidoreductase [Verrucomicrobia bacterium]|nr:TAT-variant-translocated molybdopterin oxidoreductase [Verrucomicrobiota bacterium]
MKTIPPPCPEPEVGPKYWRSLDELSETPEFREWAEREFPAGASDLNDGVNRRNFVKIMSASFLLAGFGLTGCRKPVEKIFPFSKMPEGYVHGVPQFFASAMPTRHGAIPLVVKSSDGRPTKIEGNPQHPDSNGGTDVFAQAAILGLYDPDRAQHFRKGGNSVSAAAAMDNLSALSKKFSANGGEGLSFLAERSSSPSRARLVAAIRQKFPRAKWHTYEPVDFRVHNVAASIATNGSGSNKTPYFRLEKASAILSLECDFVGGEDDAARLIRGYAKGRKIAKPGDKMNRLYVVEALMSQTGANADHRLRVQSAEILGIAAQIAKEVLRQTGGGRELSGALDTLATTKANPKWIAECAKDLLAHKGKALVLAGHRQPLAVHLIAHALNSALGAYGSTVEFRQADADELAQDFYSSSDPLGDKWVDVGRQGSIAGLAKSLDAGEVDTLVILGGNPAYNAPADLNWAKAQGKAKSVVRLGYYEDETFEAAKRAGDWHLPQAHFLESWGDARTTDGTLVPVQPLIEPLFGGVTELEVLARIGGIDGAKPHDVVRATFNKFAGADLFEEKWKKFLHDGYLANSAAQVVDAKFNAAAVAESLAGASAPASGKLEVVFTRDYSLDDGRYNNNGWLQEMPDPISKIVWDNAVLLSRKTAVELGVKNHEVVEISLGGRTVTGPVWIQPGQADNVAGLALGYGRAKSGRIGGFDGAAVGFNAYPIRATAGMNFAGGASLKKSSGIQKLVCTQDHWSMEGRPIVREANLEQFNAKPDFAKNMDLDSPAHTRHIPTDANGQPLKIYQQPYVSNPELKSRMHQWGMSIDLNSCVGCSACVIACQSENNIPIVSKDQVARGREMHWMRIDRYYAGDPAKKQNAGMIPSFLNNLTGKDGDTGRVSLVERDEVQSTKEWIDDPQVVNQPMLCQHCEDAPCESVCPVNATVHDEEGLNLMAYNRCVGTRYCSNNCAWKVRRFNFFDYNKRPLEHLYRGPTAKRPEDEFEILKLAKNPDVTVRMRGVMEKCTFCVQRIEGAKIAQKVKAGASGDVQVPEGTFKTVCEQACPAEAIVFGNILDPASRVSQLKKQQRNYAVLGFLDTKPRLTYLAKVRNPNPAMPDYHIYSLEEYSAKNGSPLGEAAAEKKGGH